MMSDTAIKFSAHNNTTPVVLGPVNRIVWKSENSNSPSGLIYRNTVSNRSGKAEEAG